MSDLAIRWPSAANYNEKAVYRDAEHAIAAAFSEISPDIKSMFTQRGGGGLPKRDLIVQNAMVRQLAMRECDSEEIRVFQLRYGTPFEVYQAVNALALAYRPRPMSLKVALQVVETWSLGRYKVRSRHRPISEWARALGLPYSTLSSQASELRKALDEVWSRGRARMAGLLQERDLI